MEASLHIFHGDAPAAVQGSFVSMHTCSHVQTTITLPIELAMVAKVIARKLRINRHEYKLVLDGVRPCQVPNSAMYVYNLWPLRSRGAWTYYVNKSVEEGFQLGVYVRPEARDCEAGPSNTVEGEAQNTVEEAYQEDPMASVLAGVQALGMDTEPGTAMDVGEIDAEAMAEEANEGDENAVEEEDDPMHAVEYYRALDASNWVIGDHSNISIWGYMHSDIEVGQEFSTKEEVIHFVSSFGVTTRREHFVVRSNPTVYEVKCKKRPQCPFHVRAHRPKNEEHFIISRYEPHSCTEELVRNINSNVDSKFIAQMLLSAIQADISMKPQSIMAEVLNRTGMSVNYHLAWRAKQKALKMLFGDYRESYNWAPRLLRKIQESNPGTRYVSAHEPVYLADGSIAPNHFYLMRLFWSFGQCIEAFRHCRPVICVDGTFLTGRYYGTLLTALAADGNNQIVPLAFAVVESENNDSWLWFLSLLKMHVVMDRPGVCIISDRHQGILHAVEVLSTGAAPMWPDVRSRWCMRHLGANLYNAFKSKPLVKRFKIMCVQNQVRKFNALFNQINERTRQMVTEEQSTGGVEIVGGHPVNTRRNMTFAQWVAGKPAEKWALAHDTDGSR